MIFPERLGSRGRKATNAAALFFIGAIAGSAVLLRFPPDTYSFYPRCPIATYLHLKCPGCGTTRALAALLHGHIADAIHLNALTTVFFSVFVIYLAHHLWKHRNSPQISLPQPPVSAIYLLLATAAIFSVVRNLPS